MILGDGAVTATIGVAIGIVGSLFVTRAMQSLLFGVSSADPITFAAITALLVFVTLASCWIPARRATRVDPLVALHYE
jgi:putative ABC transport system permease protein